MHTETEAKGRAIKLPEVEGKKKKGQEYQTSCGFDFSGKIEEELHGSSNLEARMCVLLTQGSKHTVSHCAWLLDDNCCTKECSYLIFFYFLLFIL